MKLNERERCELWNSLQSTELELYKTSTEGVWRFRSDQPGPHVWVVGAIHGNEAVGAVAVAELMKAALRNELISRGQVTLVVGHPDAFLANQRYLNQDLNRAFDRVAHDHPDREEERQAELVAELERDPPDFVLDLHSVSSGDHGIVVYPEQSAHWAERLGCLDTHFCYAQEHMAGATLIDAAQSLGAGVMVVECGHHHSPNAIQVARLHIHRVLSYFGIGGLSGVPHITDLPKIVRFYSTRMIEPGPNFRFLQAYETGSEVEAGQAFAVDDHQEHFTADKSWLMMPSLTVGPHDADAGWLCRREIVIK